MIAKYAEDVAKQVGVKLSGVSVEEIADCCDALLLKLVSGRKHASILVYRSDLDELKRRKRCERLKDKINAALGQL